VVPDFRQNPQTSLFKCRICPIKPGDKGISQKRLSEHAKGARHIKAREDRTKERAAARHVLQELADSVNPIINENPSSDAPSLTDATFDAETEEDLHNGSHSHPSLNATIISVHPMVG
jgi:hypothetical protein